MKYKDESVRVSGLVTGYQSKNGVKVVTGDINASLHSRELTCLLGPNGAGKSTLLKTLTAFLPPVGGKIVIEGRPLEEYSAPELSKVIGVVLTEKPALSHMSVEELVGLGRSPYTGFWGRLSADDMGIVDEAISLVGIESLRSRMVNTLSDGERQKVMIAKVLAQETSIIFLDEPTAFLDYPSKVEIMQLLQRLARDRNKTVFLSTHDLELALQIADKVWLLDKPHGVTVGTPEDLALDGSMCSYFQRDGVVFDTESGLFKINHKLERRVKLSGAGEKFELVRKALARQGVGASKDADGELQVEITADGYRVDGVVSDSIASLLETVNAILNKA